MSQTLDEHVNVLEKLDDKGKLNYIQNHSIDVEIHVNEIEMYISFDNTDTGKVVYFEYPLPNVQFIADHFRNLGFNCSIS